MAGKIIDEDVLKLAISNIMQTLSDYIYIEEEYDDDSINSLFDVKDAQELSYYESLIQDSNISSNRIWSSSKVKEEIAKSIIESNNYSDGLLANISSIELKYVTSLPTTGNSNTIYILKSTDTNPDTLNLYNDGAWISIGQFTISLDQYVKTEDMNNALATKANDNEVLKLDKVLTTTTGATNDNVLSAKTTIEELNKKANNDEVLKKIDISTTINSTSTNNTVAGTKAVHDSLANKLDKTVILTTVDEVNSFDREYQSFIIEPSVADAVGLPKAPDSTWFCINLSHAKGFKYPSQIAFEYAGIERIMYRTAHNGVWHNWRKLCTTSVTEVPVTSLTWADTTYFENSFTGCNYQVRNGVCFVNIDMICNSPMTGGYKLPITLPTPNTDYVHSDISSLPNATYEHSSITMAVCFGGTHVIAYGGIVGDRYLGTFSYPVAES